MGAYMDLQTIIQLPQSTPATDWALVARWVAAIAGWVAAFAGWSAFFIQRQTLRRLRIQDWSEWESGFVSYRRDHLQPFANMIRLAYGRFIEGHRSVPQTWEEAVHAAKWPKNLPMPENQPLQNWRARYGVGLDTEDEHLVRFAEAIYPAFNEIDKRTLRERSILRPEEFDIFDKARGGIADYFERCGQLKKRSKHLSRFLEEKVRPTHYYKVKLATYLELALVRAWGERSETGPGKLGLFFLGNCWKNDDKRK
jgi:hypothetical protein